MIWPRRLRLVRSAEVPAGPATTLVVGIASSGTPEEPGVAAVRLMAGWCGGRDDVRFAVGSAAVEAFEQLGRGVELLAIGTAKLGAAPGVVTTLAGAAADRLLASPEYSETAPMLWATLLRLRAAGRLPAHRAVLNIEQPPVPAVHVPRAIAAAITRATAEALALIETWRLLDRLAARCPGRRQMRPAGTA